MTIVDNRLLRKGTMLKYVVEGRAYGTIFSVSDKRDYYRKSVDHMIAAHNLTLLYKPIFSEWVAAIGEDLCSIPDDEIVREDIFRKYESNI